jgi:TM2 domain-containing membrane protein YozV
MSDKKALPVFMLCLCLGPLGVHRFYVGKVGSGTVHLLTCGVAGIWTLIDLALIATNNFTDRDGNKITRWM